ncbi:MAG: hypothetical protein WCK67_13060 [bacterium]
MKNKFIIVLIVLFMAIINITPVFASSNTTCTYSAENKVKSNKLIKISNIVKQEDDENKPQATEQYPLLDKIEKKVFNNSFQNEDIYSRLNRLELKVFKTTSNANLVDRVEKLKLAIIPEYSDNLSKNDDNDNDYEYVPTNKIKDVQKIVSALETIELGENYDNESIEDRIARLETKVFNNVSDKDPITERLERLVAIQQAQPSSKEINQNAGTLPQQAFAARAGQIGTIIMILLSLIL